MGSSGSRTGGSLFIVVSVITTFGALFALDQGLVAQAGRSSESALLREQMKRAFAKSNAPTAVFGQSTTGQFLTPKRLSTILKVSPRQVLDAHLSGCHQECTYAETRRMLGEGRHFERSFIGLNLYQMCDSEVLKRHLQATTMLPPQDTGRLFAAYWEGRDTLGQISRHLGATLFSAYGDSHAVQASLAGVLFGRKRNGVDWARPRLAPAQLEADSAQDTGSRLAPTCSLHEEKTGGRVAVTRALFATLEQLSDLSYVLALPDRSLTAEDPETRALASRFVSLLQSLAEPYSSLQVIDLSTLGPVERDHYRDGVHLNKRGLNHQAELFRGQLEALGAAF